MCKVQEFFAVSAKALIVLFDKRAFSLSQKWPDFQACFLQSFQWNPPNIFAETEISLTLNELFRMHFTLKFSFYIDRQTLK